ncbi:WD40-repeat-containing domain protein [Kickxella alabastrina]|uniref:WD40-repeat-containing domain protein n=1 Tax=Kickxella alabastrina TaxID=61397 RepID=UPI0022202728|nr:WD40-repeat-containing domain protein [Kickxella alabastrina]KAI7824940.1 WD40-repeat-containing domain protein [Kickxella alabastrina]
MSIPAANVSSDRRHFFMSSAQLEALERREELEKDPLWLKIGSPLRAGGRLLNFELYDDSSAVLALGSHQAKVADLKAKECKRGLVKHSGPVTSVAVMNKSYVVGGSRIALSASWDKLVKVWSVDNPQCILAVLTGHADFVKCLVAHPTLPLVYSGSADKSIIIWKLPANASDLDLGVQGNPVEISPFKIIKGQHTGQIYTLCLNPAADILYSAGSDASVRAWDAMSGAALSMVTGDETEDWQIPRGQHKTNIFDLKATDNGLWTASADNTAIGWDIDTCKADLVLEHKTTVTAVLPIPQVGVVVTGTRGGIIYVWSTDSGAPEIIREIHAHTDDVSCLKVAGRVFYSSGLDETLRVWDIKDVVAFKGSLEYVPAELAELKAQGQQKRTQNTSIISVPAEAAFASGGKQSVLTEEEERELAELMSDLDDL